MAERLRKIDSAQHPESGKDEAVPLLSSREAGLMRRGYADWGDRKAVRGSSGPEAQAGSDAPDTTGGPEEADMGSTEAPPTPEPAADSVAPEVDGAEAERERVKAEKRRANYEDARAQLEWAETGLANARTRVARTNEEGDIRNIEALEKLLESSREDFEKARAELLADDLSALVKDRLASLKIETDKKYPQKGLFDACYRGWKWMGEFNVANKTGATGKLSRGLGSALNARVGLSFALLGVASGAAVLVPGAGAIAFGVRRIALGGATGFASYHFLRGRAEGKLFNAEQLDSMSGDELGTHMLELQAYSKLNGASPQLEKALAETKERYEKVVSAAAFLGMNLEKHIEDLRKRKDEEVEKLFQGMQAAERKRVVAGGAAALAAIFGSRYVMRGLSAGTRFITEHLPSWARLPSWQTFKDWLPSGEGAEYGPTPGEGGVQAPRPIPDYYDKEIFSGGTEVQQSQFDYDESKIFKGGMAREVNAEGLIEQPSGWNEAALKEALKKMGSEPSSFEYAFKPGEGPLHQARKAIAEMIAKDETLSAMPKEDRIWAETRLWQLAEEKLKTDGKLPEIWHPGDKLGFDRSTVDQVLEETKARFGGANADALRGNISRYVDNVNWERYEVANGHGAWAADNGIQYNAPRVAGAREAINYSPNADPFSSDSGIEITGDALEAELFEGTQPPGTAQGSAELSPYSNPEAHSWENVEQAPSLVEGPQGKVYTPTELREIAQWEINYAAKIAHLPPSEYAIVRHMSVRDLLDKGLFNIGRPDWPPGLAQDHMSIMKRLRVADMIRDHLKTFPPQERAMAIRGVSVEDYLRRYLIPRWEDVK